MKRRKTKAAKRVGAIDGVDVFESRGNIFADLGLANADDLLARARLLDAIRDVVRVKDLTQSQIAERTGVKQPKISTLLRGNTRGFTCDRLIRILNALGQDVEIHIRPTGHRAKVGHTYVRRTLTSA